MRRLASLVLFAVLAVGLSGAGQPAPKRLIEFSQTDLADLDRVSAYLNSITGLKGDFVQVGPEGQIDQGRFFLDKPGRMRFDYYPPNSTLIVSDGHTVAVVNRRLKTIDRYPLSSTPLDLILADNIDLRRNGAILAVKHETGGLIIEARTSSNRNKANIILAFTDPVLELRQWTVLDDQGLETTVALRDLEVGPVTEPALFVIEDPKRPVGAKARD